MRAGLFPGQGLEPATVLRALPHRHPHVVTASSLLGYDLRRKVAQVVRNSRPMLPTDVAQPAIFVAGIVSFEDHVERGIGFDYLAGHSLGEYTALVAAGAIPFSHGLKLVAARGKAMKRAASLGDGGMAAVMGLTTERVEELCTETKTTFANDNSPTQAVVSGGNDALADLAERVRSLGGRTVLLPVDGAYHSDAMTAAAAQLADALDATDVRCPRIPVIANVTAAPYRAPGEIRKLLVEQLTHRVRFRESVERLARAGVDEFVDLGPGRVVGRLAAATASLREEVAAGA